MASAIARKCAPATAAASLGPCGSHAIILARSSLSQDKWVRIAVTLTRQAAQAREHGRARCIMPCARRRCCCPAALRELERAGRLTRGARQFEKRRRALECMRASRQGPPPRAGRESGRQPGTESQKAAWVRLARPRACRQTRQQQLSPCAPTAPVAAGAEPLQLIRLSSGALSAVQPSSTFSSSSARPHACARPKVLTRVSELQHRWPSSAARTPPLPCNAR